MDLFLSTNLVDNFYKSNKHFVAKMLPLVNAAVL